MYYDLKNGKYIESKENKALNFLYYTKIGRIILKIATTKCIANLYALYMNSTLSRIKISRFIKKNHIEMEEYQEQKYKSFNSFFTREIKPGRRIIEDSFISICDAKLSIYKIDNDLSFKIKNSIYTIEELIGEKRNYKYALVFRLAVDDYHHYVFPDEGKVISTKHIDGVLHTVQPIAFKKYKVFHENSREISFLDCENLGDVCYIEVGALMIGRITNKKIDSFKKGEEKGYFEFGGSTVIMLINKDISFNKKIIDNTNKDIETIVKMGQNIGKW